jgi:hypothetical protein
LKPELSGRTTEFFGDAKAPVFLFFVPVMQPVQLFSVIACYAGASADKLDLCASKESRTGLNPQAI